MEARHLNEDHDEEGGWVRDLVQDGIEPNPVPRTSTWKKKRNDEMTMWTLNTNSQMHAWEFAEDLKNREPKPDIVGLQEIRMKEEETQKFPRKMDGLGYACWYSVPVDLDHKSSERATWHGVILMCRKTRKARPHRTIRHKGGQAVIIWVEQVLIGTIYVAHASEDLNFMKEVHETFASSRARHWCIAGDFNCTPEENPLIRGLEENGATAAAPSRPTRWAATRVIDYMIGNVGTYDGMDEEEAWGDHKLVKFTVNNVPRNEQQWWALKKTTRYDVGSNHNVEEWREKAEEEWDDNNIPDPEDDRGGRDIQEWVDHLWEDFNRRLEDVHKKDEAKERRRRGEEGRGQERRKKDGQEHKIKRRKPGVREAKRRQGEIQACRRGRGKFRHEEAPKEDREAESRRRLREERQPHPAGAAEETPKRDKGR